MDFGKEFKKYATQHKGVSSLHLNEFTSIHGNYISPTIIEERQMNVASMDVFSRLMMDRIIFLGVPINDYVANIIQAQLLFLESVDAKKDILIYLNSPGGGVMQVWVFMILCSILILMFQLFVQGWLLQWVQCCFVQEHLVRELLFNIQE